MSPEPTEMKRVLVITAAFPPASGSGVLRTVKFVRHLPEFGWEPVVLTQSDRYSPLKDYSLLDEVPAEIKVKGTRVFRVSRLAEKIARRRRGRPFEASGDGGVPSTTPATPGRIRGPRAFGRTVSGWLNFWDLVASWVPLAAMEGFRLLKRERASIIYSTSPPASSHLLALLLKRATGLKWVADFRDPWTFNKQWLQGNALRARLERGLERRVVAACDVLICNTEDLRQRFLQRYPGQEGTKFVVITNGFDEADFGPPSPNSGNAAEPMVICHAGELYEHHRNPEAIIRALGSLVRRERISADRVVLHLVGGGSYTGTGKFRSFLEGEGVASSVRITGHLPHRESIARMVEADVLLLLQTGKELELQVPAKAYEYMRAGRPVLTLAPPGATASLMKEIDLGPVIDPADEVRIEAAIEEFLQVHREGRLVAPRVDERVRKFERRELCRSLSAVLDYLVDGAPVGDSVTGRALWSGGF